MTKNELEKQYENKCRKIQIEIASISEREKLDPLVLVLILHDLEKNILEELKNG